MWGGLCLHRAAGPFVQHLRRRPPIDPAQQMPRRVRRRSTRHQRRSGGVEEPAEGARAPGSGAGSGAGVGAGSGSAKAGVARAHLVSARSTSAATTIASRRAPSPKSCHQPPCRPARVAEAESSAAATPHTWPRGCGWGGGRAPGARSGGRGRRGSGPHRHVAAHGAQPAQRLLLDVWRGHRDQHVDSGALCQAAQTRESEAACTAAAIVLTSRAGQGFEPRRRAHL